MNSLTPSQIVQEYIESTHGSVHNFQEDRAAALLLDDGFEFRNEESRWTKRELLDVFHGWAGITAPLGNHVAVRSVIAGQPCEGPDGRPSVEVAASWATSYRTREQATFYVGGHDIGDRKVEGFVVLAFFRLSLVEQQWKIAAILQRSDSARRHLGIPLVD